MNFDTDTVRYCNTCMQSGGSLSRTALPCLGNSHTGTPSDNEFRGFCQKTKNILPAWYKFFVTGVSCVFNHHGINTL